MSAVVPASQQLGVVSIRAPSPQSHAASMEDPRHRDHGIPRLTQVNIHNQDDSMQVENNLSVQLDYDVLQQVNVAVQNDNGPFVNQAWQEITL